MSISIKGRDVTVTVGGAALIGTLSKGITMNGEPLDVTDDAASGWQELSEDHGVKSLEVSMSGPLKNLELVGVYFGTSQKMESVWTFPDGSTITFDSVLSALDASGDSNDNFTWNATLKSSGTPVWVAGS